MEELSIDQMKEIDGGLASLIIAGAGLIIAAYGAGYMTGKAIF